MSKQDNELTSQAGVHAVGLIVTRDLGWIFREQPVSDYGIDAHIEIVSTGASGRLLGLQIKAGASYFEEKTEDGFVYRGDQQHLDYWTNHSLPTVVVLCDLDGNCYWQNVTEEHVQRTESAWKMIIPKDQVLSADSADRLLELAQGSPFAQGLRELFLHKPWMDYIARGQVVALEAEKWVNKSLNRTTPTIVVVDNDGIESTGHQWPTMYIPGLGFIDSLKVLFQWADFSATGMVPPAFFWYHHCGYRDNWNRREWNDPTMARPFDDYMQEALSKGWWKGVDRPGPETPPRVYIECGGNTLRRSRGGQTQLLKHLWPQLKTIVTIDWRMNTTGMYSDYFLPVAQHYEKLTFHIPTPHLLNLTFCDKATEPPGEAKSEWEIARLLAQKLGERAKAKNFVEYTDGEGLVHRLDALYDMLTMGGRFTEAEDVAKEWVQDTVLAGSLPEGTDLNTFRENGYVRFTGWGVSAMALNQAAPLKPDETHSAFRWHTEDKIPYPTLTRRAQFYIDHDWFLEAGEELPVHKDTPKQGGDYPFQMSSGHNRWSIHSMNIVNRLMQDTHRGAPHMVMNNDDALARGIEDGEEVQVHNDMGRFVVPVKLSPSVRPGQVIVYNGWEPYQFRGWTGPMDTEPGMVKWLHLAGGYGHLRYWPMQWQPGPIDRAIHVDVSRLE